jgi:hypothetical protein
MKAEASGIRHQALVEDKDRRVREHRDTEGAGAVAYAVDPHVFSLWPFVFFASLRSLGLVLELHREVEGVFHGIVVVAIGGKEAQGAVEGLGRVHVA